ncbi:hypothetical protein WICPIJ_005202 [Wickerhamomyces pijperi]|uniref:Uncharacterized protein n=1 Tax=Wickerhamomyces pijperi TaxID=599730 RepID=A0A9P8Q4D0_WICPI|nr:hypothetical protein WICPIJ_005202 [Wickerhamomyces pijperi]
MAGPDSSYSCLEIHICWKVDKEAKIEPPIQTEYFLSGGAMILTFMEDGAKAVISFCIRSAIPGNMVVPPDKTMLPLWVHWGFGQQDWVFFWGNSQFVVEGVVPDLFHIVPVGDNTVFDWVSQGQDTSLGLGFITNVRVLLAHTNHDTLVSWSTNDRWEDGTWGVVTSKTGLTHTGTVIDN